MLSQSQPASLPSRERGLKFPLQIGDVPPIVVAPLAGAWIEMSIQISFDGLMSVAPLAGAWIEMLAGIASAPKVACRSPRGSVD